METKNRIADILSKDFSGWCKRKEALNRISEHDVPYFYERELWWCSIGINVGYEQDGKNDNYERPVLILRKFNRHLFLAVPQTSKPKEGKFFYKVIRSGKEYFLVLSQVRVMSSKRLLRKLGMVSKADFKRIREGIRAVSL